jgi:hypothetical protein
MPKMVTRIISPETGGSSLGILRWNIISLHPGGQKSALFLYLSPTVPRKNPFEFGISRGKPRGQPLTIADPLAAYPQKCFGKALMYCIYVYIYICTYIYMCIYVYMYI